MKKLLNLFSFCLLSYLLFATDAPVNTYPTNATANMPVEVALDWSAVTGNTGYIYQLDTVPTFDSPLLFEDDAAINTSTATVSDLYFGKTYYWRAATKTAVDTSVWSATWNFTTIDYIDNETPANASIDMPVSLNIDWDPVTGNTGYIYQYDTVNTFDSPLFYHGNSATNNSNADIANLYFGTTYYWRAAAKNTVDTSQWSPIWSFTTIDQIYNTSPANGSTEQNLTLNLDWDAVTGNTGYLYKVDTVISFDSPALVEGTSSINSSNIDITNLYFGQTYYWKAAAKNAVDTSLWTIPWSYTTKSTINLVSPADGIINQPVYLQLDWSTLTGATYYDVECDTSINFDSPVYTYNSTMSSYFYESELQFNATYYWRVRARNSYDTTQWSVIRSFTTKDVLSLISPSDGATEQDVYLQLDWSSITGTNTYQVILDTLNTFDSPIYQMYETGNSYQYVNSLHYGTEYFWKVRACHVNDTSNWSVIWSFTTNDDINFVAPTNGASSQDVYVQLDWSVLYGSGTYQIEIDTVNTFDSPEYNFDEQSSSYTYASNLLFGQTYYWHVRGCHVNDTSQWSATWSFTTADGIVLTAPSNGATNQSVYMMIDWSYFTGCASYDWEVDTTINFNSTLYQNGNASNSYDYATNLYYNTEYFWRVRGLHSQDTTQWSDIWSFTTNNGITLTSPANGATNISISPVLDYYYSEGCLGYLCEVDTSLYFNSDVYQLFESSAGTSQVSASGLLYGTTYYWRAAPRNAVDTAGWSPVWSFTTAYELTDAPVLISPADESIDISYTAANLDWNASTGAVTYQYQYSADPTFETGVHSYNTSMISGTFTDLYPHTTYYWRVRGANANGYSPWSEVWEFTTESADLVPPVLVSPTDNAINVDPDNIIIDWNSVFGASGYIYEITDDENFVSGVVTQMVTETYKEVLGLAYGTEYFWRVKSTDGAVESDWSEVWSFTTEYLWLNTPVLVSPADNTTDLDFNSVTINWNSVAGASSYIYEYSTDETFVSDVTSDIITAILFEILSLDPNTEYFWRIKATDGMLESAWSEVWSFTTIIDNLDAPLLLSPTNNSSELDIDLVTLDWESVTNATDYTYEYSTDETFASNVQTATVSNTQIDILSLAPETQYFWRVKASYSTVESVWSEVWNFTTESDINVALPKISNYNIYPNPSNGIVYIEMDEMRSIRVLDITGKVIIDSDFNDNHYQLDLGGHPDGIYFIEISTNNYKIIEKLIIE